MANFSQKKQNRFVVFARGVYDLGQDLWTLLFPGPDRVDRLIKTIADLFAPRLGDLARRYTGKTGLWLQKLSQIYSRAVFGSRAN